jgi:hypothetical protein
MTEEVREIRFHFALGTIQYVFARREPHHAENPKAGRHALYGAKLATGEGTHGERREDEQSKKIRGKTD